MSCVAVVEIVATIATAGVRAGAGAGVVTDIGTGTDTSTGTNSWGAPIAVTVIVQSVTVALVLSIAVLTD